MCGIVGCVNLKLTEKVLDTLKHRGPDDSGIANVDTGRHHVTFGHRRLSIVDLTETGHQPMSSQCGKITICYNGEVYNHTRFREKYNCSYKGHSDTESIIQAIAVEGISIVKDFNGIFAFGLLDKEIKKLYLVRDRYGVKPLYYFQDGDRFCFASEIRAILELCRDKLELKNLAEMLRLRFLPAPATLYKKIKKVRPGHVVEIDLSNDHLRVTERAFVTSTWQPPVRDKGERIINSYRRLLKNAVSKQLMSDVEIGVFLSGGIDSSLLACLARRELGYRMKAFTVGFEGSFNDDEIGYAEQTCRLLGLEHHYVRIRQSEYFDSLSRIVKAIEEPLATTSIVPMDFLAKLATNHVKVVLSGQGADESLGGYTRYKSELIRELIPAYLRKPLAFVASILKTKNRLLERGLKTVIVENDVSRFLAAYEVFTNDEIKGLLGVRDDQSRSRISDYYELLGCVELKHPVERMMAIDLRMNLADDLLLYTDKITMQCSLECRVPLLDNDLVAFTQSLPVGKRVSTLGRKKILREVAREFLPESVIGRRKLGFLSPTEEWFSREGDVDDILFQSRSAMSSYVNLTAVRKVLEKHRAGFNRERQIFLLVCLHFWFENMQGGNNAQLR
jgi:asparagine synthase (glutamine-hydrolysing)